MQKLFQFTSLFAVAVVAMLGNEAQAQWPQYTQVGEKNYIEVGLRAYSRPGDDLDFPVLQNATTFETLLSAEDATSAGSAAGVEMSYHFEARHGQQLEFRTLIGTWDTDRFIDGGNLQSQLLPGQLIDSVEYDYDARIYSVELNAKRPVFQGATLFGGPRFVHFNDTVSTSAFQDASATDATVIADTQTDRSAEAINNLIGLQAGLRYEKRANQYIRGAGFIRAGGYFNPTRVRIDTVQTVTTPLAPQIFPIAAETSKATGSLLVEAGGKFYWDFTPNCALFAGYEATWIDGIALGPPTLLTTATTGEVETGNTLFLHAVTAGLRFDW